MKLSLQKSIQDNTFLFMMGFLLILPSALNFYLELSISTGLIIFMLTLWVILSYLNKSIYLVNKKYLVKVTVLIFSLLIHTLFTYILFENEPNFLRILPSISLLAVLILTSFIFVDFTVNINDVHLLKALKILFYFMLGIGYLSAILIKLQLSYPGYSKPMIFCSEPSHFAMVFTPVALAYLYTLDTRYKLIHIMAVLIFGILIESLSLIVGTFVIIFCILERKYLIIATLSGLIVLILSPTNIYLYLLSRMNLFAVSSHHDNLSALVYLSGLERGILDLMYSYGLGIGFNNFGYMGPYGHYTLMAKDAMHGFLLCFNDGSFLFAKLIGELGIVGVILTISYLYYFIKLVMILKKSKLTEFKDILFASFYISFSIYLFVRGMGYFTPAAFMLMSSVYWYHSKLNYRR